MRQIGKLTFRRKCLPGFINPEIAKLIDRTPSTVGHALAELERVGLVKRHWVSRSPTQPKMPAR